MRSSPTTDIATCVPARPEHDHTACRRPLQKSWRLVRTIRQIPLLGIDIPQQHQHSRCWQLYHIIRIQGRLQSGRRQRCQAHDSTRSERMSHPCNHPDRPHHDLRRRCVRGSRRHVYGRPRCQLDGLCGQTDLNISTTNEYPCVTYAGTARAMRTRPSGL